MLAKVMASTCGAKRRQVQRRVGQRSPRRKPVQQLENDLVSDAIWFLLGVRSLLELDPNCVFGDSHEHSLIKEDRYHLAVCDPRQEAFALKGGPDLFLVA